MSHYNLKKTLEIHKNHFSLEERLSPWGCKLDFSPKFYIPALTPTSFKTHFRGIPTFGPVLVQQNLDWLTPYMHSEFFVHLFWHLDSNARGYWALCDNGNNLLSYRTNILTMYLMFTNRDDALMYKLRGGTFRFDIA